MMSTQKILISKIQLKLLDNTIFFIFELKIIIGIEQNKRKKKR